MATRSQMGKVIAEARKELGYTQKQMTEKININTSTLSAIENGRFFGSLDILERYVDAVGLELNIAPKQRRLPTWEELDDLFKEDD